MPEEGKSEITGLFQMQLQSDEGRQFEMRKPR